MKLSNNWPRIRRRKNWHTGTIGFLVDPGMINGRRDRRQFSTVQEAEAYAQQLRTAFQNEGLVGLSIPLEIRLEAARCQNNLAEVGASITEATAYFLKHRVNYKSAPVISKMVDRLQNEVRAAGRRERTWRELKVMLGKFARRFSDRQLMDITLDELTEYCCEPSLAPRSRLNRIRIVSQLYNYAVRNGWVEINLTTRIIRPTKQQKEPGIITVDQARRLLQNADEFDLLPFVALGLFGGVRVAELSRLDWKSIRLEEGEIIIGSDVAKTRTRRVVPVNQTLAAWLKICVRDSGPIIDTTKLLKRFPSLVKAAGIAPWPQNALRHSYASYHLAAFKDPVRTAYSMGHVGGTEVLHSHYKGLVGQRDAERFWALLPASVVVTEPQDSVRSPVAMSI